MATGEAPTPVSTTATTLTITVAPVPEGIPQYDHSDWKHWTDADCDCQDARQEELLAETLVPSQTRIVRYSMRQVSMVPLGEEAVLWEVGHLWCRRNSQSG